MMHEPTDLLPPPQIPNLDDLICAPGSEPLSSQGRRSDGLDARYLCGEDEYRGEQDPQFAIFWHDGGSFEAVERLFV